jgi:hypothetical protein
MEHTFGIVQIERLANIASLDYDIAGTLEWFAMYPLLQRRVVQCLPSDAMAQDRCRYERSASVIPKPGRDED